MVRRTIFFPASVAGDLFIDMFLCGRRRRHFSTYIFFAASIAGADLFLASGTQTETYFGGLCVGYFPIFGESGVLPRRRCRN